MDRLAKLHSLGQSIWYDNIERQLLDDGTLAGMINRGEIRGITSNPSIFNAAIAKTHQYDSAIQTMALAGWKPDEIFWQLAVEDVRRAADLFLPLYQQSNKQDGYVSLEVSPKLAHNASATLREAKRLWAWVNRPNLMIKIPATVEGLPAIRKAIAAGINVNVTLIFSIDRYKAVMEAYLAGLEDRLAGKKPIDSIASVASFFVSRVDTKIDGMLQANVSPAALALQGQAAIANARLAYEQYQLIFNSERYTHLKAHGAQVQRPLWASTSTKNPAYRDVIYVEELIGQETVNTVPPATLKSFMDHGETRSSLATNLPAARQLMSDLAALGISMTQVTDALEVEGVKAFSDAFNALLLTIKDRRKQFITALGSLQTQVVSRVYELYNSDTVKRIFNGDASVWTDDPSGQAEIKRRLGWLDAPISAAAYVADAQTLASEVQADGYTQVVLLGMGGSSLAPEVYRLVFGIGQLNGKPALDLVILDSTDPSQVRATARQAPLEKTLFIVASKSGGTSEINAFLNYFWALAEKKLRKKAGLHFVAITDPGTVLEHLARERGFRRVFLSDPSVGGRYSALTPFGLVPAALLGIDLNTLLKHALLLRSECLPDMPAGRNPGLILGAAIAEAALHGIDKLTILSDPSYESFGSWMEQLIAESSGKQGKGIIPVDVEPQIPVRRLSHDRLFIYLRKDGQMDARIKQLRRAGHPVIQLDIPTPYHLGGEFFRWEFATAVACAIVRVNGFDQPDVQDNKTRTEKNIKAYQETGRLEEGQPIWEKAGVKVFGKVYDDLSLAASPAEMLSAFLALSKPGDYVAINAYLPRNPATIKKLQRLRKKILLSTNHATTLGFGPRFLHSTGQLHKGGPDSGVFIQITTDSNHDLDIPNHGLSFGTLERAQALGDLEALLARGRRAIRIHLKISDLDHLL